MTNDQKNSLSEIETFPERLMMLVSSLPIDVLKKVHLDPDAEWVTDGKYTIAQMIHHIADAHMNKYFQLRHTLVEDVPKLIEYKERYFTELADGKNIRIKDSLSIIKAIHSKTITLLESLNKNQWEREAIHPKEKVTVEKIAGTFVSHGNFHLNQLRSILNS